MRFAKIVFIAGLSGILVLTALYFLLDLTGHQYAPPTAHPQFFCGFLLVTMAWLIAFLVIVSSPTRFQLLMIPSIVEKLGYVVTAAVLYGQERTSAADTTAAGPDLAGGPLRRPVCKSPHVGPAWRLTQTKPAPVADPAAARAAGVFGARSRGFRSAVSVFLTAVVVAHASAAPPASTTSTPMGCAPAASRDLRVLLINEAGAAQQTLDAAEAEAGTIWASAGLRLVWTLPPVPLDITDGRTVVVIVRRALSLPATVDAFNPRARSHVPLGWLVFGEDGRPGILIEVSFQALTSLVMSGSLLERPISALPDLVTMPLLGRGLGRVVAHEIGHWLMGRGHTKQGLMRRAFGVDDLVASNVPPLPRTWTAAGSEPLPALSSRCELDASHPGRRE